ncbi:DUF1624 domain-containing protein [Pedobacter sp. AJM]|uniref:DUF1624 domain-containing protein n=1 Tax=Pedobacter sp. AJM TaxID=2003629 RepID=UPI0015528C35|nr:heparan-alpha-glucosaminide N-acetyltransferase domain-containing protein [Pedobacter sp. AJM]
MNTDHFLPSNRILSIDILRGIVMIVMALDHTRDFFHISAVTGNPLDPATTTGVLFFTRWITHFCAPIFVFLSGLSAYLSAQNKTPAIAGKFLIKRGLWLIAVEIVIVSLGLTFNPFYHFIILQVIWAIGWSMILLGLISRLSYKTVLIIGLILVFGHNILNLLPVPQNPTWAMILKVLFTAFGTVLPISDHHLVGVFYAILPWTGIMFIGYAIGSWYKKGYDGARRKRNLILTGCLTTLLFLALRWINFYGDPAPRKEYLDLFRNMLSFLNVSKYPPSLQYICMTLGPAMLFLAFSERLKNIGSRIFAIYGSVPFFYYILHFYLLHTFLVIAFFATGFTGKDIVQIPFYFRPVNFGFNLIVVYLIWFSVAALLYLPCKWFKRYKQTHRQWWLRYI